MFRAAKQNLLFHDTLAQIENVIVKGKIKPGEKLPPERELRDTMLVSRTTLREALKVLEQKGLIEIKVGVKGGAYVKEVGIDQFSGSLDMLMRLKKISLKDLYEFREGVEGIAAGLATEKASHEDIASLEDALEMAYREIGTDGDNWKSFYELESRMHRLMAQISGNLIYEIIFSAIHTNINAYSHLLPRTQTHLASICDDWKRIVAHMKKGEVTRVAALTQMHAVRSSEMAQEASLNHGQAISDIILKI